MTKITIRDVAREAGVSISTVSNALNDVDVLNPVTKQHVLEVAQRLNYVPNLNGKMLKSGKTMMLGFFTTSVSGPYFYKLIETMSRQCERQGYGLNVFVTKDKSVIMSNILGRRVDGVVIYEELKIDDQDIEVMQKDKIKAVFLDRDFSNETMGSVTFDSYAAGYEAAKYLIGLGHKRIAYISGVDTMYDSVRRRDGYLAALREYNLPFDDDFIIQGYFEEDSTFNAIKAFIRMHGSKLPTAFLAGNDLSAMGCIQALKAHGYEVPGDVSVVGFDDVDIAQYFSPPLTTVRNPIARQAILTIDHLVRMIQGKDAGQTQTLTGELIVRGSSHVPVDRAE